MKLDESEQKEKQLENYKMLSALTGKSINELMGDEVHRVNYNEKDCRIKQLYLKNCINPISSKELWELLKSQGYDAKHTTFRGMLNQYQRYKYVKKVNDKKPFLYQVTEIGYQHIKTPYLAREEGIKRYREFQLHKLKEIIEDEPEVFKNIYESIHGTQNSPFSAGNMVSGGSSGSQYSPNDIGSKLQEKLQSQIFTADFFKNVNEDKLSALVDGILDNSLSDEQKKELLLDAFQEAINSNKGSIIIQKQYNPSKPVGLRNYYEYLVNGENQIVTRSIYEEIPFRFIYIQNKRELRLESESIAGKYRNNEDATVLDFDYLNRNFFGNNMIIRSERQGDEIVFYYARMNGKIIAYQKEITTISVTDYNKVKKIKPSTLKFAKTN
ncbi:hypothetical protein [Methanosarcina sp.]|mgnify:CR=1 FL=1|uniref:hypothetical protein n=1 Tax=Methanosarcina sp. TaxID=2213 RepID=UPI002BFFA28E|nr:hypothetical protein [Methanosarcina sp.]HOW14518.1 hypothetical protein [Methanosarcina sp.]